MTEYSRRKSSRDQATAFLSRTESMPTMELLAGLEPATCHTRQFERFGPLCLSLLPLRQTVHGLCSMCSAVKFPRLGHGLGQELPHRKRPYSRRRLGQVVSDEIPPVKKLRRSRQRLPADPSHRKRLRK